MDSATASYQETLLSKLIEVGIALSATRNTKELLKRITTEARSLTNSDGGSLYIREGDNLRFVVSQSTTLDGNSRGTMTRQMFKEFTIPISKESIAGYVAMTKTPQVIDDAYAIPDDKPYRHSKKADRENDYHTRSILTVPMLDIDGNVIGVLQLINHTEDDGAVAPYPAHMIPVAQALASQAGVTLRNSQLRDELREVHYDTILRLSTAAEFRDNETANHVKRVSEYSAIIADYMGLDHDTVDRIRIASPMHDIGKLGIPDAILKKPGRFTPEERKIMEQHCELGGQIMEGSNSDLIAMCRSVAMTHHEKWDGSGYPNGLKGEEIPIEGRIVALADVFDAIASKRVYKDAVPIDDVLAILRKDAGTHFDPTCVERFFRGLHEIREVFERLKD